MKSRLVAMLIAVVCLCLVCLQPVEASHKTVVKIKHRGAASASVVVGAPSASVVLGSPAYSVVQYDACPSVQLSVVAQPAYSVTRQRTVIRHYRSRSVLGAALCPLCPGG